MTGRRLLVALAVAVLTVLCAGCGVSPQDRPEPVPTAPGPATATAHGDRLDGPRLTVYLVRGTRLVPVLRQTSVATTRQALALLVDGPTRAEAADGIRTALPPEVVGVRRSPADGTATVTVTRGFTGITGGNQLLAVAQVVFTLTELPTVEDVRFTVEELPVEVPTDAGLSSRSVTRDDYRTVAPAEPAATGTPAPR